MKTRLLNPHSEGCFAVEHAADGRWDTPWAYIGDSVWGDKRGVIGNGRTTKWRKIPCNDPRCAAVLMVRESELLEHAVRVSEREVSDGD